MSEDTQSGKMTCAGQFVILLIIAACIGGAIYLFSGNISALFSDDQKPDNANSSNSAQPDHDSDTGSDKVEIGLAYGTEKKRWLEAAVREFMKSPQGKGIRVNLVPCGSREGAQKILEGDKRINAWLPASDLYTGYFTTEWKVKHGGEPILQSENLLLSPMVLVFWKDRYEQFITKYQKADFTTIGQALALTDGWKGIANKPDWGFFKFGHTSPVKSNSGGVTLILMAYSHSGKKRGLSMGDILDTSFRKWLGEFERAADSDASSTGTMMREMVLKGPSAFDCVCVYENLAIDYLKNAEGRWGSLQVTYPEYNLWNNNPYYILDLPWSNDAQKKALGKLLEYLMTPEVQKQSIIHGFRPGNPAVAINDADSPFVTMQNYGISIDVNPDCQVPPPEVVENLLQGWQRLRAGGN